MSNLDQLIALGARRKVHEFKYGDITLKFRGLSNKEKLEYRSAVLDSDRVLVSDNLLIAIALCDDAGKPAYPEGEDRNAAMDAIAQFDPLEVTKPLVEAIQAASGIGKPAEEQIAKN